jgi:hypothetical protein
MHLPDALLAVCAPGFGNPGAIWPEGLHGGRSRRARLIHHRATRAEVA